MTEWVNKRKTSTEAECEVNNGIGQPVNQPSPPPGTGQAPLDFPNRSVYPKDCCAADVHLAGADGAREIIFLSRRIDFYIKVTPEICGKNVRTSYLLLFHLSLPPVVRETGKE